MKSYGLVSALCIWGLLTASCAKDKTEPLVAPENPISAVHVLRVLLGMATAQ